MICIYICVCVCVMYISASCVHQNSNVLISGRKK